MLINTKTLWTLMFFGILPEIHCNECIQRKYKETSFVCVCNSTYCDSIKPIPKHLDLNQYVTYTTTKEEYRMKQNLGIDKPYQNRQLTDITLSRENKYQKIMGFGGAITDAAGINIASLPKPAQELLMQQYFGDSGIRYTFLRVPIGGTDFSTRIYSLDDTPNDTQLIDFKLAEEDIKYKIPYIKQAIELSKTYPIQLMGCPWSGPAYMKTNNMLTGMGYYYREYYQVYANYLTKFLQEYQKYGLNFSIMSTQNEPVMGAAPTYRFNGAGWNVWQQTDFIINNFAPTLRRNGFDNIEILVGDGQRIFMLDWLRDILAYKPEITKYIGGIGVHWYMDLISPLNSLTLMHWLPGFQDKFILYTEACANAYGSKRGATLGTWSNGEEYLESLIDTLNNWNQGWIDWNLVLDLNGGPGWLDNYVNAPIIVNTSAKEFYKNPMYYALAHVSKFLVPGSIRIHMVNNHGKIKATAFDTPDNRTVIVLLNLFEHQFGLSVQDVERHRYKYLEILPHSFTTVIY